MSDPGYPAANEFVWLVNDTRYNNHGKWINSRNQTLVLGPEYSSSAGTVTAKCRARLKDSDDFSAMSHWSQEISVSTEGESGTWFDRNVLQPKELLLIYLEQRM